jgi:hypothetical protein
MFYKQNVVVKSSNTEYFVEFIYRRTVSCHVKQLSPIGGPQGRV